MPQAAAIYARISSDPDGTRMAITRQIEDCRAFAQRRSWQVADVYADDDVSAYSGRRRPEYARMLDDLGMGRVDGVIVYHLRPPPPPSPRAGGLPRRVCPGGRP